jgi:UDP-glucose 4-epimerase
MVDNFSTGRQSNIDAAVAQGLPPSRVTLHRLDLATDDGLTEICRGADYVFHLAALADIVPSINEPLAYHRANVEGTVRLLDAVRRAGGVRKVVYAASSSCYGIAKQLPTPETAPIRPQYPYALTKTVAEQYVLHWCQVYGTPVVSLRFFNVYGPRARTSGTYGAVFGVFLAQKLAHQPFTVVGDGEQRRDFVFVSDVVEACLRAAESDVSGEVLNVGAGAPQSINRLCDLLGGRRTYLPKRPGEPDCTWADISRIRHLLDWSPRVSFEEGVSLMLSGIAAWKEAPVWTPDAIAGATADWFRYLGREAQPAGDHA